MTSTTTRGKSRRTIRCCAQCPPGPFDLVYSIELICGRTLVTVNMNAQQVVVKPPNAFTGEMDGSTGPWLNPDRMYLLHADSGERIRPPA